MLGTMVSTHIKPSRIGFEKRTFQGVNCDHVDTVVTETNSTKWMSSGLQAPAQAFLQVYFIGQDGHFKSATDLYCVDAAAAVEVTKQLVNGNDIVVARLAVSPTSAMHKSRQSQ
jgi:hypothetical protein